VNAGGRAGACPPVPPRLRRLLPPAVRCDATAG